MRKWLKRIGFVAGIILIGLIILILMSENDQAVIKNYVRNEQLPTFKPDWQGTPVDEKNRFVNAEFPFLPKISDIIRWQLSGNPFKEEKQNDPERLKVLDPAGFLSGDRDGILWLGHAAFFIRIGGKNLLIDPVFGKPPFVKTFVDVPSPIEQLKKVDYVLISHDHRDHCDEESIREIAAKFPNAKFFAGLRMDALLKDWIKETNDIQTAGWFQQFKLPDDALKIYFLPTRHWGRRALFDTNERLWGAFVIQSQNQTVLFGGDSGYGSHYRQLAELFPKIDYAIIGIGAFEPRWFMAANHNNPSDAAQAFIDTKAKYLIPMHFGRFDLSDEPPGAPLRLLKAKMAEENLTGNLKALNINEELNF